MTEKQMIENLEEHLNISEVVVSILHDIREHYQVHEIMTKRQYLEINKQNMVKYQDKIQTSIDEVVEYDE